MAEPSCSVQEGGRIMAGKVLPLGPATFPDMVEDQHMKSLEQQLIRVMIVISSNKLCLEIS